jgi:putative ATP-dependent endonuclease of OLD family
LAAAELAAPETSTLTAVLGKKHHGVEQYNAEHQKHFAAYHQRFKLGSKPAAHLAAMAELSDKDLVDHMPPRIARLIDAVEARLKGLPE